MVAGAVDRDMFEARYASTRATAHWQKIKSRAATPIQKWRAGSTYVANPPYFEGMSMTPAPVSDIVDRSRSRSSATASPPTIFLRRAASRRTRRPEHG